LSVSTDELCQTRYGRSIPQSPTSALSASSSAREAKTLLRSQHTASAVKLFHIISTTMKYMTTQYPSSTATVVDTSKLCKLASVVLRLCRPLRALFCAQMPWTAADSLLEFSRVMIAHAVSLWKEIVASLQMNRVDNTFSTNDNNKTLWNTNADAATSSNYDRSIYEQLFRTCGICLECACELLFTAAGAEKLWSTGASTTSAGNAGDTTNVDIRYKRVSDVVSNLCTLALGAYSLPPRDHHTVLSSHRILYVWSFCGRVSTQCGGAILDLLSVMPDTWKVRLKQVLPIEV
jgi:hypothetical protein